MSPYLFVLCMEKLVLLIQEKVHSRQWQPVKVSINGSAISRLFFADDCLLFNKVKASQVRLVNEVLQSFCVASGMKVSVHKSRFLPSKNLHRGMIEKFESIIGFHHTFNIGRYIGFPLLSGKIKKVDFAYIHDRINSRLACWKMKLFCRACRVTFAKSIISSMPLYTMQNLWH